MGSPRNPEAIERAKVTRGATIQKRRQDNAAFDAEIVRLKTLPLKELLAEIGDHSFAAAVGVVDSSTGHEVITAGLWGGEVGGAAVLACFSDMAAHLNSGNNNCPSWVKSQGWNCLDDDVSQRCPVSRCLEKMRHRAHLHLAELDNRNVSFLAVVFDKIGNAYYNANDVTFSRGLADAMRRRWTPKPISYTETLGDKLPELEMTGDDDGHLTPESAAALHEHATAAARIKTPPACQHDFILGERRKYEWCRKCGEKRAFA